MTDSRPIDNDGPEAAREAAAAYDAAAARLIGRREAIVEAMLDRLWDSPALERWTSPETREPARAIAEASIVRELDGLRERELPVSCPPEDLAAARAAVAYGAPVTVVLQCYRAGHAALWDAWLEAVDELRPEPAARRALLEAGARFMFDYVDRCSAWVEAEHSRERERVLRGEEQRRVHLIRELLDGGDAGGAALEYDLDGDHLGLVSWGDRAMEALGEVTGALGREPLAVSVEPRVAWGWVPGPFEGQDGDGLQGLRPTGARLAAGGPARGVDGFRRAHSEALQARRVAEHTDRPVTRFRDVALEALGMESEERARAFVERELAALGGAGARDRALRATLRAYFEAGQHASSAAARLGVHERTVANRLRAIEERIGRPVPSRRAELEMALRLERLLDGS